MRRWWWAGEEVVEEVVEEEEVVVEGIKWAWSRTRERPPGVTP